MKEDYSSQLIFSSGLTIVFSGIFFVEIFSLISRRLPVSAVFAPNQLWFWGAVLGSLIGLAVAVFQKHLKFVETLEAAALAASFPLATVYIVNFIYHKNSLSIALAIFVLLLIALFYFMEGKYRRFPWYKSGRVGFSGLLSVGVYFLLRIIIGISSSQSFSFIGRVDIVLSAVVAFLLFFSLYNLSER
jgi:hypothetical protein